jgi:beta-glucosidase
MMLARHMPEEPAPSRMGSGAGAGLEPEHVTMAEALKNGSISESTINRAADRVLGEIIRFGYMDGMQKPALTEQDIDANACISRNRIASRALGLPVISTSEIVSVARSAR